MAQLSDLRIYLVDDHELVREGLRTLLDAAGYAVVGEAGTVEAAVEGIVERMGLAEKTVKNYVSRVLAALGLRSRTQAALFATSTPAHASV